MERTTHLVSIDPTHLAGLREWLRSHQSTIEQAKDHSFKDLTELLPK